MKFSVMLLEKFCWTEKEMHNKLHRILLRINTGLFISSKYLKFDRKYAGNMCTFNQLKTKSPKKKTLSGHFS